MRIKEWLVSASLALSLAMAPWCAAMIDIRNDTLRALWIIKDEYKDATSSNKSPSSQPGFWRRPCAYNGTCDKIDNNSADEWLSIDELLEPRTQTYTYEGNSIISEDIPDNAWETEEIDYSVNTVVAKCDRILADSALSWVSAETFNTILDMCKNWEIDEKTDLSALVYKLEGKNATK